MSFIIKGTFV